MPKRKSVAPKPVDPRTLADIGKELRHLRERGAETVRKMRELEKTIEAMQNRKK
jgi:hypothetical protein